MCSPPSPSLHFPLLSEGWAHTELLISTGGDGSPGPFSTTDTRISSETYEYMLPGNSFSSSICLPPFARDGEETKQLRSTRTCRRAHNPVLHACTRLKVLLVLPLFRMYSLVLPLGARDTRVLIRKCLGLPCWPRFLACGTSDSIQHTAVCKYSAGLVSNSPGWCVQCRT
jgi:hypothetical protein